MLLLVFVDLPLRLFAVKNFNICMVTRTEIKAGILVNWLVCILGSNFFGSHSVRYGSTNQANSAFHPFGVGK